jgi:hypothetical protein
MRHLVATLALAIAAPLLPATADAAIRCVSTADQLRQALQQTSGDGFSDEIRLFVGVYAVGFEGFRAELEAFDELQISGGWFGFGPCHLWQQVGGPESTTIDGQDYLPGLVVTAAAGAGNVGVANLSVRDGHSESGFEAAGINVIGNSGYHGDIDIDRVRVRDGYAPQGYAGGIFALTGDGRIRLRGSVIDNNSGAGAGGAALFTGTVGTTYASNNTVAFNYAGLSRNGGIGCGSGASCVLANNVIRSNFGTHMLDNVSADVDAMPTLQLLHNNIRTLHGTPAAGSTGNQAETPGLVAFPGAPAQGSILIDAGVWPVPGDALERDFEGNPRVLGAKPDIGAYEYTGLFSNRFEAIAALPVPGS